MNIPQPIVNPELKCTQLFINNEFVDAKEGGKLSVEDPATGKEICKVAEARKADIDAAVAAARKAFQLGSEWRKMPASQKGILLNRLADLMEKDRHYLASLDSWDSGKLYAATYLGDLPMAINILRYFAGWSDKDHGKTIPWDNDHFAYTRHEPIGVCGAIIPWNFPLTLFCFKLGPCIATGNVLVMKPAEITPLSALYMGFLIKEAGFPPGVVNIVPGYGNVAGDALSHHMDVDKIAFTGSTAVGRLIQKASAESNLKRVSLELGGKSPNIVLADVDLDFAVEMSHTAIFSHNGQVCCAGSRTFVQESIYDEFVKKSVERAKSRAIGDPKQLQTTHGPQVSKVQQDKIVRLIQSGKDEGCKVLCGGGAVEGKDGYYVQPTVLTDLRDDMQVSQEEIFGPVQQIYKFKDISEVIKRANNTTYGLAAAVFTNDINKAIGISNAINAGTVWINCYFDSTPGAPFGGYKMSGIGRDLGEYALREYTQVKVVVMKLQHASE